MKIKEILEARYAVQKPSVLDVHYVSQRYKQFSNNHISDQELWDEDKPSINQRGTITQGFTSLEFTFRNKSKKDAEQWVRNFIGTVKLPYTEFLSREPRGIGHLIAGNENQYTQVVIKYEEHGMNEARYAGEHPIVKAIKSSIARGEHDFFMNIKDKKEAEGAEQGIIAAFGQPDEQGPATADQYRHMLWRISDEFHLQIVDGLPEYRKLARPPRRGMQQELTSQTMMNIELL